MTKRMCAKVEKDISSSTVYCNPEVLLSPPRRCQECGCGWYYGATVAQTTQACTAQLPAFPPLDSRPAATQPVPASDGRLVDRKVFVVVPVSVPPPPTARLPDGQSTWKLFGPVLLEGPVDEICCSPLVPVGPGGPAAPAGPCGPAGICPIAKSTARSDWFFTLAELTAFAFS